MRLTSTASVAVAAFSTLPPLALQDTHMINTPTNITTWWW